MVRKDNSRFYAEANAEIIRDANGEPKSILIISRDISDRKRAEEEVIRLNAELEQRVLDRTAQLEAANKDLEAFSYSVSHDLRTPLRALDGFANILMEDYAAVLDDEGKRMLKIIISNANNMGHLIDELLSFSRLGRTGISYSEIDMREMAESVFNEYASETDKEKISFRLPDIPEASGDPAMIKQIWVNLITNAIKFTSKKPDRNIEIGFIPGNNETVYFVRDNGAGFDMANSSNMFGVFKRLHTTKEFDGTGVGLAIVKRIVQRHKGSVRAEGVVNEGATIYFSIPFRK
jgi:light-regulated signal transduction histidine kinase (bacteriophytochrome)